MQADGNPLVRNAIWEEVCRKEARTLRLNEVFSISDPRKMRTISEKPNRVIPTPNPNPESVLSAKRDLEELCQIKHFEKSPSEIDSLPQTTNQEYGFHHQSYTYGRQDRRFLHPRGSCEMTKFADKYTEMNGSSPFARAKTQD